MNAVVKPGETLRVALFWPKGPDITFLFPIGLGYLKSNTVDPRFKLEAFDCAIEDIDAWDAKVAEFISEFQPHVVGVSAWSAFFPQALELIRHARRLNPEIVTVMGGIHPSSYPAETIRNEEIDFVVAGEAEFSFTTFLTELCSADPDWTCVPGLYWLAADGTQCQNPLEVVEDLDQIRFPDYDFIDLNRYITRGYRMKAPHPRNAPIWATRGCPYRCNFCSAYVVNGKRIRRHSIDYLMRWVKYLYDEVGIRWINIVDDNFTFKLDYAKEFCESAIEMNLPGLGYATSNGIRMQRGDPELWRLMKKAGWQTVIVAPESGSPETLELMKKDLKIEIVPQIVDDIRNAGLKVHGFFMIGYPGETREYLQETYEFIKNCNFSSVNVQRFQPLPGTPIYSRLLAEGKITPNFLPNAGGYGDVNFIDEGLKDFNFPRFILKVQLMLAICNPITYVMAVRNLGLAYFLSSIGDLLRSLFRQNKPVPLPKPGL
jgi:magnesium-protoporphyrin IX monomethyl ester (oxidative) cyclase